MATGLSDEAANAACKTPPADTKVISSTISDSQQLYSCPEYVTRVARYRPKYPSVLVDTIASYLARKLREPWPMVVDLGCGSGSGTRLLCSRFGRVIGCDISQIQLDIARSLSQDFNVEYILGSAEKLPFEEETIDVLVCGLSIHFFNLDLFFVELDRVLKPGGCLAAYGFTELLLKYNDTTVPLKPVTKTMEDVYKTYGAEFDTMHMVAEKYANVEWPYEEKECFEFQSENLVDLDYLENYLATRLAHETYIMKTSPNEGKELMNRMRKDVYSLLGLRSEEAQFYAIVPMFLTICRKPL